MNTEAVYCSLLREVSPEWIGRHMGRESSTDVDWNLQEKFGGEVVQKTRKVIARYAVNKKTGERRLLSKRPFGTSGVNNPTSSINPRDLKADADAARDRIKQRYAQKRAAAAVEERARSRAPEGRFQQRTAEAFRESVKACWRLQEKISEISINNAINKVKSLAKRRPQSDVLQDRAMKLMAIKRRYLGGASQAGRLPDVAI